MVAGSTYRHMPFNNIFQFTTNLGWLNCTSIKIGILLCAQLDHSMVEAARLKTESGDIFPEWRMCMLNVEVVTHMTKNDSKVK